MEERPDLRRAVIDGAANSSSPSNPLDKRWFVHIDEKTYGPYDRNDIKRLAADNRIVSSDWLCPEGGSAWIEAENEPTLGSLFRPPALTPQPPPRAAAQQRAPHQRNQAGPSNAALGVATERKRKRFGYDPKLFFQRADQEAIREDLREFFGPLADKYISIYEKMRSSGKPRLWCPSLSRTGSSVSSPGQPGEAVQMPPSLAEMSR